MDPNSFLEYLCSLYIARRDRIHVNMPCPHYPYQDSLYVTRGTNFNFDIETFLVEFEIVLKNDTVMIVPTNSNPDIVTSYPITLLKDIYDFLKNTYRNWAHHQPNGIPLVSNFSLGDGTASKGYSTEQSVNIDALLVAMSMFFPISPGDALSFANALSKIKDLIPQRKYKEVSDEIIEATAKSVEAEKKRIEELRKKNRGYRFSEKDSIEYSPISNHNRNSKIILTDSVLVKFHLQNFSDLFHHINNKGDTLLYYKRGDTIFKDESRIHYYITPENDTIKDIIRIPGTGRRTRVIKDHNLRKPY